MDATLVTDQANLPAQNDNGHRKAAAYEDETFLFFLEMVYDEKEILKNAVAALVDRFLPSEKRNKLIEVGAGTGDMLDAYIDKFSQAILIEPSNKYHNILGEKFPDATVVTDSFQNLEPESIGRPNCICASHVMRYLPDPLDQLDKMLNSLSDGGKVIITMSDLESQYTQFIKEFEGVKHNGHEFNIGDVKEHLASKGINFDTEIVESHFKWESIDELIRVMPVVLGGISADEITEQNRLDIAEYVKQFRKDDGTYEIKVGHEIIVVHKPKFQTVPQEA